jgi:AraC-like DNA-binding protein
VACSDKQLVEQLSRSALYKDYERAFSEATGLPLALQPLDSWQMALHGKKNENPFCALMAKTSRTCAACLEVQARITSGVTDQPKTAVCFAGLTDAAVPIRVGDRLIGFLQTGQVMLQPPKKAAFDRTAHQLRKWGRAADLGRAEDAYYRTRVLSKKQYVSMLRLLTIFGQHLSIVSNQLSTQSEGAQPPVVTRAREFIARNQDRDVSLGEVAQAVNTSIFYFCKLFKKTTGHTFTDYLSRVRIEKAKTLLLNPSTRVSEVAYAVGFQSLTHFNRMFRKLTGQSPSAYRAALPHAAKIARGTSSG